MRPSTPSWNAEEGSYPDYSYSSISTPGSNFQPTSPFSPYEHPEKPTTPGDSGSFGTPGYHPHTPGATPQYGAPLTPGSTPHTPGTPGNAFTPSAGGEEDRMDSEADNWATTDIEVKVGSDFRGGQYEGVNGVIREVSNDTCKVSLDSGETINISISQLKVVQPSRKDPIKILRGPFRDRTGTLIGIDILDGIVKMDHNMDIKIFHLTELGRVRK